MKRQITLTPKQKLAAGRMIVTKRMPYFATAMRSLVPVEYAGIKSMAVTPDAKLLWAPAFVERLSPQETAFVLAHELMHVMRGHLKEAQKAGIEPGSMWSRVANIAMDCEINDDIRDAGFDLPTGDLKGVFAADFGLEDGKCWQEYFIALRDQINQDAPMNQKLQDIVDQDGQGQDGDGQGQEGDGQGQDGDGQEGQGRGNPMPGQGDCGSGTGNPHPNEPSPQSGDAEAREAAEVPGRSDRDIARIRRDAAQQVNDMAEAGIGNIPGRFRRWADGIVTPPKIDWRTKLSRSLRQATTFVSNGGFPTYNRPSRSQPVYGFGVGRPLLPRYRRPVPRVAVVVDTSGSMADKQIADSVSEVAGVIQALGGGKVTFISGDCAVNEVVQVRTLAEVQKNISGGGGTDFRPPFRWALEQPKKERPDILVYCTDGMGPAPAEPPPGIQTIWVLVGPYREAPATWGEVIDLEAA